MWSRVRGSRLTTILLVYLGASWFVVQVANELRESLELPSWVSPVTIILLLVGMVVVGATAWVQALPTAARRAERDEVPDAWELDLGDFAGSLRGGRLPHLTWPRVLLGGLVSFCLLFGFAGLYVVLQDRNRNVVTPVEAGGAPAGLAVLPFSVRGPGLESWQEGMVDLLSLNLDGTGGLRAADSRTVLARWKERLGDGEDLDLPAALDVARAAGATHAITGTLVATGSRVRLTATIHDVPGGRTLDQVSIDGPLDSLLALVDGLSAAVVPALLEGDEAATTSFDIRRITTGSFAALDAYLEGEALYRGGDFEAATAAFERAVSADPDFALALYRLVAADGWTLEPGRPAAEQAYPRLAALVDRLPVRERILVKASDAIRHGRGDLVDSLRQGVALRPGDAEAWYMLGESYYHMPLQTLTGFAPAREAFERAVDLDPGALPYQFHLLDMAFLDRPDGAASISLIERLERSGGTDASERYRQAHRLMFGDSLTREAAWPWFDSASVRDAQRVWVLLGHPVAWAQQERVMRWYLSTLSPEAQPGLVVALATSAFRQRGRVRQALSLVDSLPGPTFFPESDRACLLLQMQHETGAVPADLVRRHAAPGAAEPGGTLGVSCAYLLAALEGRREDAERLRNRLVAINDSAGGATDGSTGQTGANLPLLDRLAAMLSGRPDPAPGAVSLVSIPSALLFRRLVGELLLEADRPADAIPWLEATRSDPLAHVYLGRAYEALDRLPEAREAYEYFLTWWGDADPEASPPVEAARTGLERIATQLN